MSCSDMYIYSLSFTKHQKNCLGKKINGKKEEKHKIQCLFLGL